IKGELLRHVTDALTNLPRAQTAPLACELHFARCRSKQPAEHLDGCRLTRPVRSEQSIHFAIRDLHVDVLDRSEVPELFCEGLCANGNLTLQVVMVMHAWKRI